MMEYLIGIGVLLLVSVALYSLFGFLRRKKRPTNKRPIVRGGFVSSLTPLSSKGGHYSSSVSSMKKRKKNDEGGDDVDLVIWSGHTPFSDGAAHVRQDAHPPSPHSPSEDSGGFGGSGFSSGGGNSGGGDGGGGD